MRVDGFRVHHACSAGSLKPSVYNVETEPGVIFNTVTGALLRLSPAQTRAYGDILERGDTSEDEAARGLHQLGFVLESPIRELQVLRYAYHSTVQGSRAPLFTIAPTLDCNFGCDYCFEDHQPGFMSAEVQGALSRFIRARCAGSEPLPMSITWFGGEPLMGVPVLLALAAEFDALAAERVIASWDATLITNGLLASPKTMERLSPARIKAIQITIDGARDAHDARRALKNKQPTFDKICENLAQLPSGLATTIRVNVDRRNMHGLKDMMVQLATSGALTRPEATVNLAIVESYEPRPAPGARSLPLYSDFLSSEEFARLQSEFAEFCGSHGWRASFDSPRPTFRGVCQVDNVNAFVVSPTGELMKCWAELGNRPEVSAHLLHEETWPAPVLGALEVRDPFDDPDCVECQLLPICMGGCPKTRAVRREGGTKECPPIKYRFDEAIAESFPQPVAGEPQYVTTPSILEMTR